MGFDSNGTFTRWNGPNTWQNDATAGTKILADRHDEHDDEIANALSRCLLRDGYGGATANISMAGFKIINHGPTTNPTDVATKSYVDGITGWSKSKYIGGADLDGRLNFTNITGTNGITWTNANMALVGRVYKASEASQRLAIAGSAAPSTTSGLGDLLVIDDVGHINTQSGMLTHNLSWVDGGWRTITPGLGSRLNFTSGDLRLSSNDVATITNNYATATLREYFSAQNSVGSPVVSLFGASSGKSMSIRSYMAASPRWFMYLGDGAAESGTAVGANFLLRSYANDGATYTNEIVIARDTHRVTFKGEVVTTNLTTTDPLMTVGPSTAQSTFAMQRPITTGSFTIYGGQSGATGAYMTLYGEGNTANARDIVLGSENTYRYFFDYSANTHYWANNAGTQVMRLSATGVTVTGTMTVSGAATFAAFAITDTSIQVGPTTAASTFAMTRPSPVNDGYLGIYGGYDSATGAYLRLWGNANSTQGNDYILGSGGATRYQYDYSLGRHVWNHTANLMYLDATNGLVVAGHITSAGTVTTSQNFDSTSTTCILSATNGGNIRLRPDGPTATATQATLDTNGNFTLCNGTSTTPVPTGGIYAGLGIRTKVGTNGLYGDEFYNFDWAASALKFYYGTTTSVVTVTTCDYRVKRDVIPLRSVWDKIKALKPISYRQQAFQMWEDDNAERWGLVAHEAQEALGAHAATGEKDGEEVQTLNAVSLIAALTRGLQEAMQRIEALEAA